MGAIYRVTRAAHAQSTSNDSLTINIPAGYRIRLLSAIATGMDSAAAAGSDMGIYRVTTVGSGGSPTTVPLRPADPNTTITPPSGLSAVFGYTTQPVVDSNGPDERLQYQPLGGKGIYQPAAGAELVYGSPSAASQVSFRGIAGTGQVGLSVEFELI